MVDFIFMIRLVVAAASSFIIFNITAPIMYNVWYVQLRDDVTFSNLQATGDMFFGNWLILQYMAPGLIIIWGFVVAQRKRVSQTEDVFY